MSTAKTGPEQAPATEYLRRDAAAKYLGISTRCLSNWQKRRIVAFHKLGRRATLFKRADLDAAVRKFRVTPAGE